ncbi:hypothetical protein IYY11_02510 [Methylocystis sp. H62]|uniref:hypothetical protein n=1 Tax=Methylocystis sp. H62 TaxID=2785789 RepID=UPI0018C3424A|nr:hypothetical protein [Methylocystis sp. H62]MBG0792332.1 hypothetical protein [Methylocystis sp. H62]
MTIEGTAIFERPTICQGGVLRVSLLKVDRIDAPSTTLAGVAIPADSDAPISEISFGIEIDDVLPERARYGLAAHLDLDADGSVTRGDLVTVESCPWRPGQAEPIRLRLRLVS